MRRASGQGFFRYDVALRENGGSVILPDCPLGADAHMRLAKGVLQRRRFTRKNRGYDTMEGLYIVTGS